MVLGRAEVELTDIESMEKWGEKGPGLRRVEKSKLWPPRSSGAVCVGNGAFEFVLVGNVVVEWWRGLGWCV